MLPLGYTASPERSKHYCPIISSVTYQEREAVGLVDRLDGGEGVDEPRVWVRVAFLHDHVGWLVLVHLVNEKTVQT